MQGGFMKEVTKLDYFLYTLDTHKLIMKDTNNYTKWFNKNGTCVAMMEKRKGYNKFWLNNF